MVCPYSFLGLDGLFVALYNYTQLPAFVENTVAIGHCWLSGGSYLDLKKVCTSLYVTDGLLPKCKTTTTQPTECLTVQS